MGMIIIYDRLFVESSSIHSIYSHLIGELLFEKCVSFWLDVCLKMIFKLIFLTLFASVSNLKIYFRRKIRQKEDCLRTKQKQKCVISTNFTFFFFFWSIQIAVSLIVLDFHCVWHWEWSLFCRFTCRTSQFPAWRPFDLHKIVYESFFRWNFSTNCIRFQVGIVARHVYVLMADSHDKKNWVFIDSCHLQAR